MTKVMFRTFCDEVTALFPEIPGTNDPYTMLCYAHIGQHGAASEEFACEGHLSTPEEYEPLLNELKRIGYDDLEIVTDMSGARAVRSQELKRVLAS